MNRWFSAGAVALAVVLAGTGMLAQSGAATPPSAVTAFVNVNAVPMASNQVLANWTVVISDGKVVSMGPSTAIRPPAGATVIDGRGKYLMPGLTEMHGHIPPPTSSPELIESVLFLYVANGVTTVRGMQGAPGQLELRERAARGEIVAPTLYLAGPQFSGQSVTTPEQATERVRQQSAEGWDLLKVQTGLSLETYEAMATAAKQTRIPFGGHVPSAVGVDRALSSGQVTIDHLDGFVEMLAAEGQPIPDSAMTAFAERVARSGVWVVPTMYVWETLRGAVTLESRTSLPELQYLPGEQIAQWTKQLSSRLQNAGFNASAAGTYIQDRMRLLKALSDAGARILLGSDAPQQFNVPGFSLHREMRRMQDAGMSIYDVLRSGTSSVGAHLISKGDFGTIAIGHRADFILVDANPLADLANVQKRTGVMLRGRWIPEAEIQKRLAAIAAANKAVR